MKILNHLRFAADIERIERIEEVKNTPTDLGIEMSEVRMKINIGETKHLIINGEKRLENGESVSLVSCKAY